MIEENIIHPNHHPPTVVQYNPAGFVFIQVTYTSLICIYSENRQRLTHWVYEFRIIIYYSMDDMISITLHYTLQRCKSKDT